MKKLLFVCSENRLRSPTAEAVNKWGQRAIVSNIREYCSLTLFFMSKCERGERRIDIAELREFCIAIDTTLEKFIKQYEKKLR